ncbi:MAG TPA: hypothetical protein VF988_15205 [Verrucomicrobiae bacterium]
MIPVNSVRVESSALGIYFNHGLTPMNTDEIANRGSRSRYTKTQSVIFLGLTRPAFLNLPNMNWLLPAYRFQICRSWLQRALRLDGWKSGKRSSVKWLQVTSCGFSRVRQKLGKHLQAGLATPSFVPDISSPALLAEEADFE